MQCFEWLLAAHYFIGPNSVIGKNRDTRESIVPKPPMVKIDFVQTILN